MIEPLLLETKSLRQLSSSAAGSLMNSSEELIARARAGEAEAFQLIFERYAKPVLGFIYEMTGQRDLAEELVQETFVRAFNNLDRLREETRLSSWLFGIGRNVARESLRSRSKENFTNQYGNEPTVETVDQNSPSEELLSKELNMAVRKALASLVEDQRLVFVLKVYQHCRYDEIAEITGFSVAKVKTDLHRARAQLRELMRPFLETTR